MADEITNFDISSLLENRTFLSFLSQAGAGIAGEDSFAADLNPLVQQNIGAQSMREFLTNFISSGGKASFDEKGLSAKIDPSIFSKMFKGDAGPSIGGKETGINILSDISAPPATLGPTAQGVGISPGAPSGDFRERPFNPLPSPPDIRNVDLAGLTAKDIQAAFGLKLTAEEIRRKTIADISMTELRRAQAVELEAGGPRTTMRRNFDTAKLQGFKGSIIDFQNSAWTPHQKNWKEAKEGGYEGSFWTYVKEITRLGATSIGEFRERKEAAADVKQRAYFSSSDFLSNVDKKVLARRSEYEAVADSTTAKAKIRKEEIEREVKNKFPNAWIGEDNGVRGWYIGVEGKEEFITLWQ